MQAIALSRKGLACLFPKCDGLIELSFLVSGFALLHQIKGGTGGLAGLGDQIPSTPLWKGAEGGGSLKH